MPRYIGFPDRRPDWRFNGSLVAPKNPPEPPRIEIKPANPAIVQEIHQNEAAKASLKMCFGLAIKCAERRQRDEQRASPQKILIRTV